MVKLFRDLQPGDQVYRVDLMATSNGRKFYVGIHKVRSIDFYLYFMVLSLSDNTYVTVNPDNSVEKGFTTREELFLKRYKEILSIILKSNRSYKLINRLDSVYKIVRAAIKHNGSMSTTISLKS